MARPVREVPWLSQRDGLWYAYWYDKTERREKRLSLRTRDADEAQDRFSAFLTNRGAFTSGAPQYTVAQALDDYRREHVTEKVIDRVRQEGCVLRLREWFGDTPFSDVDIPKCREYANARRSGVVGGRRDKVGSREKGTDSTIRRELGVLRAAANHAMRWRRLGPTANPPTPMPSIERPMESRKDAQWLTQKELAMVLRYAEAELHDFIVVAYYTGARRDSVQRLTPFQIDLAQNRINLRRPDETPLQRNSKKRRPIVPIDPALRPVIERLLMKNARTGWLFGKETNFYYRFRGLLRELGMPEKGNPHILRHSRASHLLQQGVSLFDVAKLLGDTVATVERVYGHHSSDHLATAIAAKVSVQAHKPTTR